MSGWGSPQRKRARNSARYVRQVQRRQRKAAGQSGCGLMVLGVMALAVAAIGLIAAA
jgi:hypothetical protein